MKNDDMQVLPLLPILDKIPKTWNNWSKCSAKIHGTLFCRHNLNTFNTRYTYVGDEIIKVVTNWPKRKLLPNQTRLISLTLLCRQGRPVHTRTQSIIKWQDQAPGTVATNVLDTGCIWPQLYNSHFVSLLSFRMSWNRLFQS